MEVIRKVFLENENKRVTIFSVVPDVGKEAQALKDLKNEVDKLMNENPRAIYFNAIDTPFSLVVIEGLNF